MFTVEQLEAQRAQHLAAADTIKASITAEAREPTNDERSAIDQHLTSVETISGDIDRLERIEAGRRATEQARPRRVEPNAVGGAVAATVPAAPRTRLFNNLGDFALAVHGAAVGRADHRLNALAPQAAAGDVITTTDGYPVPQDLRQEIQRAFEAADSIVGRCLTLDTASNEIRMPAYEAVPGTAGALRVYWTGEGNQITEEKATMGEFRLPLHKLAALVPVTEEALADAPLLDSFIRQVVPETMTDEIDNCLLNGTGVGKPLGVLGAPAAIEVAKESAQANGTILFDNVRKMWARLHPRSRASAVWMVGTDLESALMTLQFAVKNVAGTENVGGNSIYLPAGVIANQPFGLLMGRPVIVTHHSPALGQAGDIALVDWRRYGFGRKTGGVQVATSMHLYFDRDKMAFRFTYRIGGQPLLSKPVAQRNGGSTLSPFVKLAARA
jgi:HK97 family phage major capsid protein